MLELLCTYVEMKINPCGFRLESTCEAHVKHFFYELIWEDKSVSVFVRFWPGGELCNSSS